VTAALAALSYAAIDHAGVDSAIAALLGVAAFLAFIVIEQRSAFPMMPLGLFKNRQFACGNLVTLSVYAALSGSLFLVTLQLQRTLHYSPLRAGAATVPFTILMLTLSSTSGRIAQRIGARVPMTIGPVLVAIGLLLFSTVDRSSTYLANVLPAVLFMGLGMAITVAPLTAAVLADIDDEFTGIGSGINNAMSRFAGLLAVAALPALAGVTAGASLEEGLRQGYSRAMVISAIACVIGAAVASVTIRGRTDT
jgi:MFS family permease